MGLPGFDSSHSFVLLDHRPGSVFRWLQSADDPEVAFVVVDPLMFEPTYPLDLVRRAAGFVGLEADEEIIVLVICTVPAAPEPPTANFMAPIGIGRSSRRGAQVVLHDSGFGPAQPFLSK